MLNKLQDCSESILLLKSEYNKQNDMDMPLVYVKNKFNNFNIIYQIPQILRRIDL